MKKYLFIGMSIMIGISLTGVADKFLHAEPLINPRLQPHIDVVKKSHPQVYQKMVDKAKGNITECLSCHADIFKDANKPKNPRRR